MSSWRTNPVSVVLIGRVNVGKSTLFNKMTEKTRALMSRIPGTTRDANQGLVEWNGKEFTLIDTGGWQEQTDDEIITLVSNESMKWAEAASLVLLAVDAKDGILPEDKALVRILKKKKKKVLLIINKIDKDKRETAKNDAYGLGLGEPLLISATEGRGVGDLLDLIIENINVKKSKVLNPITISLIGKPNVGKSSTVNAIAGKEIMMVSATPHTTREPHPVFAHAFSEDWLIVDTAGIRRKSKVGDQLEKRGTHASIKQALTTDVNWLLIDISKRVSNQDKKLSEDLIDTRRGLIIVANKWDLVENKTVKTQNELSSYLRSNFRALKWARIMFVSAKDRKGYKNLLALTKELNDKQNSHLDEVKLREWWKRFVHQHKDATRPKNPNRRIKFLGFKQIDANPITFQLSVGNKDFIPDALIHIMEKEIRDIFDLYGVPFVVTLKHIRL
jgi:GTP-binding protein